MSVGPQEVASPCISVCELDEQEICLGCGRSLQDIADWSAASDSQRQQILETARVRQQQSALALQDAINISGIKL